MGPWIHDIDRLLRGGFTRKEDLAAGRIEVPVSTLIGSGLALGALYGVFMGSFACLRAGGAAAGWEQLLASTVKVPLLFLLTLLVTFPSLYVFSALANSRLLAAPTLRLLLAAIAVNLAVVASFGPVTGFFTVSTESYPFMVLLNVAFFAVGGFVGLAFLRRALEAVFAERGEVAPPVAPTLAEPAPTGDPLFLPPVRRRNPRGLAILRVWVVIYAVVGAQMGWILRPFIGTPNLPFTWFRQRGGNFLIAVLQAFENLFKE